MPVPGPYLTAVDLADIAQQLDDEEAKRMAEGDLNSEEYKKFLEVLLIFSIKVIFKNIGLVYHI